MQNMFSSLLLLALLILPSALETVEQKIDLVLAGLMTQGEIDLVYVNQRATRNSRSHTERHKPATD